jgi:hypothetical protein
MAPLVKSPAVTPEKLAANKANGRQSHGPATAEGLERCRESSVRHGFYTERGGEALRALGEDPDELERLLESLRATWQPSDEFQERLVERLGRALWRLERSDRVQDSIAVKQVREVHRDLGYQIDKGLQGYDNKLASLEELAQAVCDQRFVAGSQAFVAFNIAFGEQLEGRAGEILTLLYKLLDPKGSHLDAPAPDPELPIATGADRAEGRELVASLLREEIEAVTQARQRDREAWLAYNAPYYRDSAIPHSAQRAGAVFRMEETSFRQIAKFTDLLLRLKAKEAKDKAEEAEAKKSRNEGGSHDVIENKGQALETHDVNENK